jgi:hypothetical protein
VQQIAGVHYPCAEKAFFSPWANVKMCGKINIHAVFQTVSVARYRLKSGLREKFMLSLLEIPALLEQNPDAPCF